MSGRELTRDRLLEMDEALNAPNLGMIVFQAGDLEDVRLAVKAALRWGDALDRVIKLPGTADLMDAVEIAEDVLG